MIRVLAFIEALGVTGPARNLFDTAAGVDLRIATFRRWNAPTVHHRGVDDFLAAARRRGIPAVALRERFRGDPTLVAGVTRMIAETNPDVIQSHNIKSHALVALPWIGRRIPWAAFHHGYTDTDLKVRVYNRLDRWILPRADAVVTPCRAFADDVVTHGVRADRVSVIYNGIDPRRADGGGDRNDLRRRLSLDGTNAIVAVGRLSREKGHDLLIDACAALPGRESATLVFAGDGPERESLMSRARAAGVRLRIDGFQEDVRPYYGAADVFVLPSRSEGCPNALLEAMTFGCPIVASAVGGVAEIVAGGESALLAAPASIDGLRDGIAQLLSSADLRQRLSEGARRRVAAFTPEKRLAALFQIYQRLLAPSPVAPRSSPLTPRASRLAPRASR